MSHEKDMAQYRKTADRVKRAVHENNLFDAMEVAMNALREAVSADNKRLKDEYLSLVWSVYIMLEDQYASAARRKARQPDA